jgi:hypothetical protein
MKMIARLAVMWLLIVGLFAIDTSVFAATTYYYVDADATGPNYDGSIGDPFKTIAHVEAAMPTFTADALRGDDVFVYFDSADTWNANGNGYDYGFQITCQGTPEHWIIFDGKRWGTGTEAKIYKSSGDSQVVHIGNYPGEVNVYIKFHGFEVDGGGRSCHLIGTQGASFVTISDCYLHDTGNTYADGISFFGGNYEYNNLIAEGNTVYSVGAHGIAFYCGGSTGSFRYCTARRNVIHSFGNWSCRNVSAGFGIMMASTWDSDIYQNVIYDGCGTSEGGCMSIEGTSVGRKRDPQNLDIYRNIMYGGNGIETRWGIFISDGSNINVYSNVFHDISHASLIWGASTGDVNGNTVYHGGTTEAAFYFGGGVTNLYNNIIYQTVDEMCIQGSRNVTNHGYNNFFNTVPADALWIAGQEPNGFLVGSQQVKMEPPDSWIHLIYLLDLI